MCNGTNFKFFVDSVEARVIETGGNSAGNAAWDNLHTALTDNAGIGGTPPIAGPCAVSDGRRGVRAFLSMKLEVPRKILSIQLAFRTDGQWTEQGKNVLVQVGSKMIYNPNDPVCKEIDQLAGIGLVEYECDKVHEGQYVILSNDQNVLTICEAKVFGEAGKSPSGGRQQPSKWSPQPSPWSSGLWQPAAASCSLGFSMTQFCVKYYFHLQSQILDDTILCQVLLVRKRMA